MKKIFTLFALLYLQFSFSQTTMQQNQVLYPDNADYFPHKSIHQEELEKYAHYNLSTDAQWDSLRKSPSQPPPRGGDASRNPSCLA